jgi:signal transduction histidine kinase
VETITHDFLPSLLIRQSAILPINDHLITSPLFTFGLDNNILPGNKELGFLLRESEKFLFPELNVIRNKDFHWIRLILPLYFNGELIGLWLFGDRNPDNFYNAREIEIFKSIASSTAITLINIRQSDNLVGLYRDSINREEEERARLSRDIHDIPLNNLAAIKKKLSDKKIDKELTGVINELRQVIRDLRPELISFGLYTALEDLTNNLNARQNETKVSFEIDDNSSEFDEKISLHVFRIIQQACENALKHAHCKNILIQGQLNSDFIVLNVIDDGIGFDVDPDNNFSHFLENQHYGLVGMFERAFLVDATLQITSELGSGSIISFRWKK